MATVHSSDEPRMPDRTPFSGFGVLLTAVMIALAAGPLGIVAGISLFVVWAMRPGVYAFALAYLFFAVLAPDPTLVQLVILGGGTLLILIGSLRDVTIQIVAMAVVTTALLWGVVFIAQQWTQALWLIAITLSATVGLLVYGLHRYELVRLGLVEADQ